MDIFLDIETVPAQPEQAQKQLIAETITPPGNMSKQETIDAWHAGEGKYAGAKDVLIEEQYRKTSFDGAKGEVISVAFAVEDGPVVNYHRNLDEPEHVLLRNLFRNFTDLNGRVPYFIGHYIGGFDLKFLFQRAVVLGVNPGFDLGQYGRHGKQFYDTMMAWAGYKDTISLDNLCKALSLPGKPDDIDGSKVWDFVKAGKIAEVAEYNISDVEKVRDVYHRLNFTYATEAIKSEAA